MQGTQLQLKLVDKSVQFFPGQCFFAEPTQAPTQPVYGPQGLLVVPEGRQLLANTSDTEFHRAGEISLGEDKIHHIVLFDDGTHLPSIGAGGGEGLQQRPPEQRIDGGATAG